MGKVCYAGRSLGEFFEHYNTCLWLCKEQSNWFRSPEIPGDYSPLEADLLRKDAITGIADLETDAEENRNVINKFMKLLHK